MKNGKNILGILLPPPIIGWLFFVGGLLFVYENFQYVQVPICPGFGCYTTQLTFNSFGYWGLLVSAAGAILLCEAMVSKRRSLKFTLMALFLSEALLAALWINTTFQDRGAFIHSMPHFSG